MFSLITNTNGPLEDRVNVYLDIGTADFDNFTDAVRDSVATAERANRRLGCIVRICRGETWFSYQADVQTQLEALLIAAQATPRPVVQATFTSGGDTWAKY